MYSLLLGPNYRTILIYSEKLRMQNYYHFKHINLHKISNSILILKTGAAEYSLSTIGDGCILQLQTIMRAL